MNTTRQRDLSSFLFGVTALCHSYAVSSSDDMLLVGDLWVDRTEVSISDFSEFSVATSLFTAAEAEGGGLVYDGGWQRMLGWTWRSPFGQNTDPTLPAVHITFDEATDYCRWADKRLPTDREWQTVAYTEFRLDPPLPFENGNTYLYPTGDTPDGANCLNDCGTTTAIDFSEQLARGTGPASVATGSAGVNGLHDMGANVWEWTDIDGETVKGTRGGSWWYGSRQMERDYQATKPRDTAAVYIGFRCVRDR